MLKKLLLVLCFCLASSFAYGKDAGAEEPRGGNFALSGSQRPGPLIGFGENIIDQHRGIGTHGRSFLHWLFGLIGRLAAENCCMNEQYRENDNIEESIFSH